MLPFVDHIPAIARVAIIFFLILGAVRLKLSLGNAFLLSALVLGVLFGLHPATMARSVAAALTHPKTLSLAVIVTLILVLSHSMENTGQMQRLLDRFEGLVRHPRINLTVFPALIGLLPMPGGAIFSAPMVKTLGSRLNLSGPQLSYTNYWFRHIWEYWWPLYPGVLLTTALADLDLWIFVLVLFPLTALAVLVGFRPLRAFNGGEPGPAPKTDQRPPVLPFLKEMTPISIAIGLGLGSGLVFSLVLKPYSITITKEMGLILALLVSIAWVWHTNRMPRAERWQILTHKQLWRMFYMVAAILVFKGMLEDSHAVEQISRELMAWHIPLMPITMILPFLVGGVVGITIAFVGATFPILISLINAFGESHFMPSYMMLALVSGFAGVLLSPAHLCLLLSNEYFEAPMGSVYRYLWFPCVFLLAVSSGYFWLLHGFMKP